MTTRVDDVLWSWFRRSSLFRARSEGGTDRDVLAKFYITVVRPYQAKGATFNELWDAISEGISAKAYEPQAGAVSADEDVTDDDLLQLLFMYEITRPDLNDDISDEIEEA